ncbi:uncharacterized protein LOC135121091 isoform X2 [Zophobas morio]|uniref:uncharacterized protein LOC135121091 isoform X2 n=1 Tax=Zophobas morio TaxID=2755281 RepID=UPI0030835E9B
MVNSGSFGSDRNGNTTASCMQTIGFHSKTSPSPLTASSAIQMKHDFTEVLGTRESCGIQTAVPTSSENDFNDHIEENGDYDFTQCVNDLESHRTKKSIFCSLPLDKVQTILSMYTSSETDENKMKVFRKVLCLYCDRTFVNVNLRQKHVERCHSSKQLRRVSLRKHQNLFTCTPCIYCDKFTFTERTLKDLFKHLVENHANKYFGCLSCEMRFVNFSHLTDHNVLHHKLVVATEELSTNCENLFDSFNSPSYVEVEENRKEILGTTTSKKQKVNKSKVILGKIKNGGFSIEDSNKTYNIKNFRTKKISVKSSRMILKRSKRLQAKLNSTGKKQRTKNYNEKKKNDRLEQPFTSKLNERPIKSTSNFVNPYPEFDNFFQVKKITDHSIDNLKISSLTFDDVFDKAFFNKIKCNIQENLLHHIDGKLFKNEESENRISNFEKISNIPQETQNLNTENYGCELSLNAVTPTTLLLSNQLGDDPESQIEYGSKPSKKKTQLKKDEVHYKYFTRRKYQASILEHKENRDLSKLDMWTQFVIKSRQQKILDDKRSPKEILDYFAGEEYKNIMKREELNRILDRRGPFEDLREEVSKKAALDKLNGDDSSSNDDHFTEIGELLNDILNRVFELAKHSYPSVKTLSKSINQFDENIVPAIPSYLNLRPSTDVIPEDEIDRSDKIALICSSQETENFEHPSNTVRGKNEKVELTGEWARSRIFVCAACGLKLENIKQFLEHKSTSHQYIWVQHYEFVGNQSQLYKHLSIPVLGKVGVLENIVQCKVWKRSDARSCTKCDKLCNSLTELHRHILECGGDWTWMLARKKCKYRPFGAKSRRKRRGLVKRIYAQKTEPSEKKKYKKTYLPKQKPSDADTIKRMLANLPPKRATRRIMCLKDGFNTSRSRQTKVTKQSKFKCGKLIRGRAKEQKNDVVNAEHEKTQKCQTNNYRRSLRCLNKVLSSRILDTNTSLIVKRKCNRKVKTRQKKKSAVSQGNGDVANSVNEGCRFKSSSKKVAKSNNGDKVQYNNDRQIKEILKFKRSSPRIEKFNSCVDKMNIKHFFPVKKNKKNMGSVNHSVKIICPELGENDFTEVNKSQNNRAMSLAIDNGQLNNINLRKRKIQKHESNIPKQLKNAKSLRNKKRKLKNSSVSTVSEASLQVDIPECITNKGSGQTEIRDFFEKCQIVKGSDSPSFNMTKLVDVNISQKDQGTRKDNQQPNSNKNKCTNESILQNTSIERITESAEDRKSYLIQSFRSKKKVKKPVRGLNDCIAMLTNKLGIGNTQSIITEEVPSRLCLENSHVDQSNRSKYILKVPLFEEEFQSPSSDERNVSHTNEIEHSRCKSIAVSEKTVPLKIVSSNELRDLNSRGVEISDNGFSKLEKNAENHIKVANHRVIEEKCINENSTNAGKAFICDIQNNCRPSSDITSDGYIMAEESEKMIDIASNEEDLQCFGHILTCEEKEKTKEILDLKGIRDTDSEDEIPLSSLVLKNDQHDRNLLTSTNEHKFSEFQEICDDVLSSNKIRGLTFKISSANEALREGVDTSTLQIETIKTPVGIETDRDNNVLKIDNDLTLDEDHLCNRKNVAVLTEISDNLCEYPMSLNVGIAIHIENSVVNNSINHEITGSEPFTVCSTSPHYTGNAVNSNFLKGSQKNENVISLDAKNCNDPEPKLEEFDYIRKRNVDAAAWEDTIITNDALGSETLSIVSCDIDNKHRKDSSEYKENSLRLLEETGGKRKHNKKSTFTNEEPTNNKSSKFLTEFHIRETVVEPQKNSNNKKSFINTKTKILGCMAEDVSFDLSENKLRSQSNLKSGLEIENMNKSVYRGKDIFKKSNKKQINASALKSGQQPMEPSTLCKVIRINDNEGGSLKELTENHSLKKVTEMDNQEMTVGEDLHADGSGVKQLRRSLRNSKKVTCYSETDVVDSVLDDLDCDRIDDLESSRTDDLTSFTADESGRTISKLLKERTKDMFGTKRKNRKSSQKKSLKNGEHEKKFSGDGSFDLLKTSMNESMLSKSVNTFVKTLDKTSHDFNADNSDIFEHKMDTSVAVNTANFSQKMFPLSQEITEQKLTYVNDNYFDSSAKILGHKKKKTKCKSKKHKSNNGNKLNAPVFANISFGEKAVLNNVCSDNVNNLENVNDSNHCRNQEVFCEICNRQFRRISLSKHRGTITHIAELSKLDLKEAALQKKYNDINTNEETANIVSDSSKDTILLNTLGKMNAKEPEDAALDNAEDSPILPEILIQRENEIQSGTRRCKNLAERKSFESENCFSIAKHECHNVKSVDYFEPEIVNGAAGTIVEKQLTLLQNIIENRSGLGCKEDLSDSLSSTANEISAKTDGVPEKINSVSMYAKSCSEDLTPKQNIQECSLDASQFKEISETNLGNYDEEELIMTLRGDEKLFFECCSLLKNRSKVSSYSKKSNNSFKGSVNLMPKTCGEGTICLESNCSSQKENEDFVEHYSDSSKITTTLGESFTQEKSNSGIVSLQWDKNNAYPISDKEIWKQDLTPQNKNLTFEEVFNDRTNKVLSYKESRIEELHTIVSSFDRVLTEVLNSELNASSEDNVKKSLTADSEFTSDLESNVYKDSAITDGKKVLTKGAMKVFEGLKVSIPTEELNMDKILTILPESKTPSVNVDVKDLIINERESKENTAKPHQFINRGLQNNLETISKAHDVYDFEETQDNSDVFTKPDFRSFRTTYEKCKKFEKLEGSDDDSQDFTDAFSFDALSSSASSVSEVFPVKSRSQQNITKKKCMIMGRIFKNAVKSRIVDEDIRNIPIIDNTKLVEDFVLSCQTDKKPRMTEEEMNLAFDKLINNQTFSSKQSAPKTCLSSQSQHQRNSAKRKQKTKNKKRNYSDSSDDEFRLQVYSKKRIKKKNSNSEEGCINLEQELRECIGVASRKSQRKCTSGKQNILMEYWSSDESSFEMLMEKQIANSLQNHSKQNNGAKQVSIKDWHHKDVETNLDTPANNENINQTLDTQSLCKRTKTTPPSCSVSRRKRAAANPLYHWSSSSEDESRDLIEVKPVRDEFEDDEDRPVQHGWIVGDSPKKLVTMLAQGKGKKCDIDSVKEHSKKRTSTFS